MKVIIAGSRDFDQYDILCTYADRFPEEITEVVSGCARGADMLGEEYARDWRLPIERFPANWHRYGQAAGVIRNCEMAEYADGLLAFLADDSRGTADMILQGLSIGLSPIVVVRV